MSATLRSFDINGESPVSNTHNSLPNLGKSRTPSYKRKKHPYPQSTRNVFNSDEDDIEFDDTRIETPKDVRRDRSHINSLSGSTSSLRQDDLTRSNHSDYFVRNTTIKVPLKDGDGSNESSRKVLTPTVVNRANRFRSRNGTPLRLPPISSSNLTPKDEGQTSHPSLDEVQDNLIRSRKLISDDNKLSPGRFNSRLSSQTQLSSNGLQNTSPVRNTSRKIENGITSPPSNLRIKPLDLNSFTRNSSPNSRKRNRNSPVGNNVSVSFEPEVEDIEFDSSDIDENDLTLISSLKRKKGSPKKDWFRSRRRSSVQKEEPDNQGITKSPENLNSSVSDITVKHNSQTNSKSIKELGSQDEISKSPRIYEKVTGQNGPEKDNENQKAINIDKDSEDISRANLLERINITINSIKDNERSFRSPISSPKISASPIEENDIQDENGIEYDQDSSSSESPVEILKELDSHLVSNNISSPNRSPSAILYPNLQQEESFIQSQSKQSLTLASKYFRNNGNKAINGSNKTYPNSDEEKQSKQYLESSSVPSNETKDWPIQKWFKLMKVLESKNITKNDIINSEVLAQKLGCVSKNELKQRVDFLLKFKKLRERNNISGSTKLKKYNMSKTAPKLLSRRNKSNFL